MIANLLKSAFPALSERSVRLYLLGQLSSVLGNWTQNITLCLLMWDLTHSAPLLGLLNFLLTGPMLVLPVLVGSRLHQNTVKRNALLIIGSSFAVTLTLLGGVVSNQISAPWLLICATLLGAIAAIEMPTRQILLTSSLVDKNLLPNAVAMNTLVFNIGRMVGPAVAALAFTHLGAAFGFALNAFGLAVMLLCVTALPIAVYSGPSKKGGTLIEALNFSRTDAFAKSQLPMLICLGLFVGSYQTLIPVLADRQFGSVANFTGIFFGCVGVGSLSAALLLSARPAALIWDKFLYWTPWLCAVLLATIAASNSSLLTGGCFSLLGLALTFSTTRINSTMQRRSPDRIRGGVVGLYAVCFMGTMPLGHLLMGFLSGYLGPRITFATMAIVMVFMLSAFAWRFSSGAREPE